MRPNDDLGQGHALTNTHTNTHTRTYKKSRRKAEGQTTEISVRYDHDQATNQDKATMEEGRA